jgi:hypothetical protein
MIAPVEILMLSFVELSSSLLPLADQSRSRVAHSSSLPMLMNWVLADPGWVRGRFSCQGRSSYTFRAFSFRGGAALQDMGFDLTSGTDDGADGCAFEGFGIL